MNSACMDVLIILIMQSIYNIYALITPPNLAFASPEQNIIFNPSHQDAIKYDTKIFIQNKILKIAS